MSCQVISTNCLGMGANEIDNLLNKINPSLVVLSGGNDVGECSTLMGGDKVRFDSDKVLFDACRKQSVPVLGVCYGMQLLNVLLGGCCTRLAGHVGGRHMLKFYNSGRMVERSVNSYHNFGISEKGLATDLLCLASDNDGMVEAFKHRTENIFGIMWHPERNDPFDEEDVNMVMSLIGAP